MTPDETMLLRLLVATYSGERAAALAYTGHRCATTDPQQRARLTVIAEDEWEHREVLLPVIRALGGRPSPWREVTRGAIGVALGLLCHVFGPVLSARAAARLETKGANEYDRARRLAVSLGRSDWARTFTHLAQVERDHRAFFVDWVAQK